MILYFSGTGNSLAVARQLAERLNERLMPLIEAVKQDLTNEKRIGLVFPTYDFNLPPAMRNMVAQLNINPQYKFYKKSKASEAETTKAKIKHHEKKAKRKINYNKS